MQTFVIRTAGPVGPRGARPRGHVFVVVAADDAAAKTIALEQWQAQGETVTECTPVANGVAVCVGGF